ncbi:MAG: stage II sporulation protein M [Caulobacteraceae bacterium]
MSEGSEGGLRSHRFRLEREGDWRRLERLLARAEGGALRGLSDEELIALPVLYRAASSSLSTARAISLDAGLIAYLEGLVARGYFFVYGVRGRLRERLARFFAHDWPAAVRGLWRETLVAAAILIIAAGVGFWLVSVDPDWYGAIMPGEMAQGRDPTASTAFLKHILYDQHGGEGLSAFATFLFTHNAQIAILAFALGFAFCLPTALLIAGNGLAFGALLALYASRGLAFEAGGWLLIHGSTELFATVIAGAAGFHIGWSVIFPGPASRLAAAARAGRAAGAAMAGVVVMLVFAGVLEGVGRQTIRLDGERWAIAGASLGLWLAYFYLPRKRTRSS